jgi:hypothetical protein
LSRLGSLSLFLSNTHTHSLSLSLCQKIKMNKFCFEFASSGAYFIWFFSHHRITELVVCAHFEVEAHVVDLPKFVELDYRCESSFEGDAAYLEGVFFFFCRIESNLLPFSPHFCRNYYFYKKCEYESWRNHNGFSFEILPAVIGLDLVLGAHIESMTFVSISEDGDAGLKARFCRGNELEGLKCACPSWRASLGLQFVCSSLQTGVTWTRGFMSCIPKVFFFVRTCCHYFDLRSFFNVSMRS